MTEEVKVLLNGAMVKNSRSQTGTLESQITKEAKIVCTFGDPKTRDKNGMIVHAADTMDSSVIFSRRPFKTVLCKNLPEYCTDKQSDTFRIIKRISQKDFP